SQQRLDVLQAWREVALYSDRERAALALTEAVTLVADGHVADDVVDEARRHFTAAELAQLVFVVVVINSWNRVATPGPIPLLPPGARRPGLAPGPPRPGPGRSRGGRGIRRTGRGGGWGGWGGCSGRGGRGCGRGRRRGGRARRRCRRGPTAGGPRGRRS